MWKSYIFKHSGVNHVFLEFMRYWCFPLDVQIAHATLNLSPNEEKRSDFTALLYDHHLSPGQRSHFVTCWLLAWCELASLLNSWQKVNHNFVHSRYINQKTQLYSHKILFFSQNSIWFCISWLDIDCMNRNHTCSLLKTTNNWFTFWWWSKSSSCLTWYFLLFVLLFLDLWVDIFYIF